MPIIARLASSLRRFLDRPSVMYWIAPGLLVLTLTGLMLFNEHPTLALAAESISTRMLKEGIPLALLAIGAALVLSTGGVDISIAGVATAGGVAFATVWQLSASPYVAVACSLMVGGISGWCLGLLVNRNLPSLIVSWSIGALWIIVALLVAESGIVSGSTTGVTLPVSVPPNYWRLGGGGLRIGVAALAVVILGVSFTNLPRKAKAIGANRDSAIYAGIRVKRTLTTVYALCGALAAMAGILLALVNNGARVTELAGLELTAIAVAILGGTVMTGGYLFLPSVAAAALFWTALQLGVQAAPLSFLDDKQHYAASGLFALIVLAVLLPLGRRLSGPTQTISAEPTVTEERG